MLVCVLCVYIKAQKRQRKNAMNVEQRSARKFENAGDSDLEQSGKGLANTSNLQSAVVSMPGATP